MWRELSEWERHNTDPRGSVQRHPQYHFNQDWLRKLQEHFFRVVRSVDQYRMPFLEAGFTLEPSPRPDSFQFYFYLSESFGRAASYLSTIEFGTALALFLFSGLVGCIAFFAHIEFRFLMEPILVFTLLFCGGIFVMFKYMQGAIERSDSSKQVSNETLMGPKRWAKITQFLLIILFYSFSRLILSRDIWKNYFWQAVWATAIMVAFFLLLHFVLVDLMHITVCWLSLPPNAAPWRLASYVQAIAHDLDNAVRNSQSFRPAPNPRRH